jgi:hypothetical protein
MNIVILTGAKIANGPPLRAHRLFGMPLRKHSFS